MIRFSAINPEVLRRINRGLFHSGQEYVVVDEAVDDPAQVEAMIDAVPAAGIASVLHWMGEVPEERFEWAWPRFMAGNIAQQYWPDGNHRTSFLLLSNLAEVVLEEQLSLPAKDMMELLAGSKRLLQQRLALPGTSVFSLQELDDEAHPYRRHFERFVPRIVWS